MIIGAVLLAAVCWAVTFGLPWGNFWGKIGVSVVVICLYSFIWRRPAIHVRFRSLLVGMLYAAILYAIFYLGFVLSPWIIPGASHQVGGIYAMGEGTNKTLIFLLLLFVTGPGEEIFWRGFLQEKLVVKYGKTAGFVIATLIYGGVHLFSLNIMLILAAFVAGAFWGGLYLWKRDLFPVIVSHSLWSAVIFAVFPIH